MCHLFEMKQFWTTREISTSLKCPKTGTYAVDMYDLLVFGHFFEVLSDESPLSGQRRAGVVVDEWAGHVPDSCCK